MFGKPTASGQRSPRRPGERALAIANFRCALFTAPEKHHSNKDCFGVTPKPTRDTRALPRLKFDVRRWALSVERWTFSGRRTVTDYTLYRSLFLCRCARIRLRRLCLAIFAFRLFLREP